MLSIIGHWEFINKDKQMIWAVCSFEYDYWATVLVRGWENTELEAGRLLGLGVGTAGVTANCPRPLSSDALRPMVTRAPWGAAVLVTGGWVLTPGENWVWSSSCLSWSRLTWGLVCLWAEPAGKLLRSRDQMSDQRLGDGRRLFAVCSRHDCGKWSEIKGKGKGKILDILWPWWHLVATWSCWDPPAQCPRISPRAAEMSSSRTEAWAELGAGQGRAHSGTAPPPSHWSRHCSRHSNRSNQTHHHFLAPQTVLPPPLSRLLYCFQISENSCECLKLLVIEQQLQAI